MSHAVSVASSAPRTGKAANIALWIVQIAAAALLLMAGGSKLTGDPKMVQLFATIGIGQWFRYLTGGLEVIGAVMLLIPFTAGYGAVLLSAVMTGAVLTHLFVVGGNPTLAIVLLIAVLGIAWGRLRARFA